MVNKYYAHLAALLLRVVLQLRDINQKWNQPYKLPFTRKHFKATGSSEKLITKIISIKFPAGHRQQLSAEI